MSNAFALHIQPLSGRRLREVPHVQLARADDAFAQGRGWLVWRSGEVLALHLEGPLQRELMPRFEAAVAALAAECAAPKDVLIDASAARVGLGVEDLEAVADLVARLVRRFGPWLRRVALVAPSDWSTPWWHGLPLLAGPIPPWRTYASWTAACAWLDVATPAQGQLEQLVQRLGNAFMADLERAVWHDPASDLGAVARRLGFSKRTLQRALVREGIAFHSLRTRLRLERAERLLAHPSSKVSAVASDIGFASAGHFILWFRRHRGVTPGAWRARLLSAAT